MPCPFTQCSCCTCQPVCWELWRWSETNIFNLLALLSGAGREVLRMYARLRGVPRGLREGLAERLLQRLSLAQYADR